MIELISSPSVYGQKVHIVLEETGLPYTARLANVQTADGAAAEPLGRTPSLYDPHGPDGLPITLGESGAIVSYLARKARKLGPESAREIAEFDYVSYAIAATLSPQFAVLSYLQSATDAGPSISDAFVRNALRILHTFEERMATRHFMAGERFTVLDALLFPHLAVSVSLLPKALADFPNLARYRDRLASREGVKRGMAVLRG